VCSEPCSDARELIVEAEQVAGKRFAVRGDGLEVSARSGAGDRAFRRLVPELLEGAECQRQEGGARLRLRHAGRVAERAYRLREERDLPAGRQHRRGMIERTRRAGRQQRRHSQADRELREVFGRTLIGCRDAGGEPTEAPHSFRRERAQRVERSGPGTAAAGGGQRRQAERAGEVGDELARADVDPAADLGDCPIRNGEEHDVHVAQRRRLQTTAAVPGREDAHAGRGEGLEQRPRHCAAAEHCGSLDHSRRNSTPVRPAHARSVSPLFTRPARISSASGDSTRRWITCRIGRAPRPSWYPPAAIR
jgi:hypothetical protein